MTFYADNAVSRVISLSESIGANDGVKLFEDFCSRKLSIINRYRDSFFKDYLEV